MQSILDLQHHVGVTTNDSSALREQQHDSGWQLHSTHGKCTVQGSE